MQRGSLEKISLAQQLSVIPVELDFEPFLRSFPLLSFDQFYFPVMFNLNAVWVVLLMTSCSVLLGQGLKTIYNMHKGF